MFLFYCFPHLLFVSTCYQNHVYVCVTAVRSWRGTRATGEHWSEGISGATVVKQGNESMKFVRGGSLDIESDEDEIDDESHDMEADLCF